MIAFVTGGTGFVGSHLIESLLKKGVTVRAMVRTDPKWLKGLDVEIVKGDLFSPEALRDGLSGVDQVFHVAGLTRARTQEELDRANVEGTINLLTAIRKVNPNVQHVQITSSLAAVGPSGESALLEDAPLNPLSRYGISKARMEVAIGEHFANVSPTIIRPPAVYGPREADIYTIIKTADKQRVFPIVGDPSRKVMSLVHVEDLVRGMIQASDSELSSGKTYFLGSREIYSWGEIRDAVRDALGKRLLTVRVPPALATMVGTIVETGAGIFGRYPALNREKAREGCASWVCSIDAAANDFGYEQRIPLTTGIAETVAWYRKNGWL